MVIELEVLVALLLKKAVFGAEYGVEFSET
jgi:hypothetical protein